MVFNIRQAEKSDKQYAETIVDEITKAALGRSTGITSRTPKYIEDKILDGNGIIAFSKEGVWAGFCYLETWTHKKYVANSGLIVNPDFRENGLAKTLKETSFAMCRNKYPEAKIFGLTTSSKVSKINSDLGYTDVTYLDLIKDKEFLVGCSNRVDYPGLISKHRDNKFCKTMLYNPNL